MSAADDAHRPWPRPAAPWVMAQTWHDLLFAHWPLPPDVLRPLIPESLALDAFEGRAWVGVLPFRMGGVRLRWMPPFPGAGAFPELNLRTYVTAGDKPGVWFFSLDARSALAVRTARAWFHLPYFRARMSCEPEGGRIRYASERVGSQARVSAAYAPSGEVEPARPGTLEHWLTERYCLYAWNARRGALLRAEIHHPRWPLQRARGEIEAATLAEAAGFALPDAEPLLHFARRLDVRFWSPRRVESAS